MEKSPEAFRTISEVAELLDTPAHVLRFWESRFPQVRPVKRAGGRRYYRPSDVELLTGIKRLLHDDGMTIRGVQKVLREQGVRFVAGQPEEAEAAEAAMEVDVPVIAAVKTSVVPFSRPTPPSPKEPDLFSSDWASVSAVSPLSADQDSPTAVPEAESEHLNAADLPEDNPLPVTATEIPVPSDKSEAAPVAIAPPDDSREVPDAGTGANAETAPPAPAETPPESSVASVEADAPAQDNGTSQPETAAQDKSADEDNQAKAAPGPAPAPKKASEPAPAPEAATKPIPESAASPAPGDDNSGAPEPTQTRPAEITGHWLAADLRALKPADIAAQARALLPLANRLKGLRDRVAGPDRPPRR